MSRREDIEAAIAQHSGGNDAAGGMDDGVGESGVEHVQGEIQEPGPDPQLAAQPEGGGVLQRVRDSGDSGSGTRARSPDGKFAKGETTQTKAPTPGAKALVKPSPVIGKSATQASPPIGQSASVVAPPAIGATTASPAIKAPQSWKAEVREKWAALPPEVQQEVARREREAQQGLEKHAEAAKFRESFQQAMAPYQAMLGGADPIQATRGMYQTVHALQYGPAPQKAQLVAQIIRQYGVDIEQLASHLDGTPAPTQQAQSQSVDPNQIAQQVWQQIRAQQAQSEANTFKQGKEFLSGEYATNGVAQRIEARMSALLGRGIATDLEDAYNQATWADPDTRATLQDKAAAEAQKQQSVAANASNASTQRRQAAASSVKSQPAAAVPTNGATSRREQIMEALAAQRRGT